MSSQLVWNVLIVSPSGDPNLTTETTNFIRELSPNVDRCASDSSPNDAISRLKFWLKTPRISQDTSPHNIHNIFLVITEFELPKMTVYKFLQSIKENSGTEFVHVVVIDSVDDEDRHTRCALEGATHYCTKPMDRSKVEWLMQTIMQLENIEKK